MLCSLAKGVHRGVSRSAARPRGADAADIASCVAQVRYNDLLAVAIRELRADGCSQLGGR
jgi:hypothetical protein